jgi:hypothetical protein
LHVNVVVLLAPYEARKRLTLDVPDVIRQVWGDVLIKVRALFGPKIYQFVQVVGQLLARIEQCEPDYPLLSGGNLQQIVASRFRAGVGMHYSGRIFDQ